MGVLSDWFDVDPDTEDTIKDVVKAVGLIVLLLGGAGAAGDSHDLPFEEYDGED